MHFLVLMMFLSAVLKKTTPISSSYSLFKSLILMLQEGLECDSHVLILVLLSKFVAKLANAVLLEQVVHLLLL